MRVLALLAMTAALAACENAAPAPEETRDGTIADVATVDQEQQTGGSVNRGSEPVAMTGQSPTMRGNVSGLNAAVSDLNVRMTDLSVIVELPADVLFEFDRAELASGAAAQLAQAADYVRRGAEGTVRIIGHTDAKGADDYNQALSLRRAEAVRDWFAQQPGVRQRKYEVVGKGESEPIAPNTMSNGADDPAGRARNRRVEIVIPR